MGVVSGILLASAVATALAGFHFGHHAHIATAILGLFAAASIGALVAGGGHPGWLWALLAGDVALVAGAAFSAWRGLAAVPARLPERHLLAGTGATGVAISDLDPDGIVKVRGERWSAVAVNAPVPRGNAVHVVGRGSVRLQVWGEATPPLFDDAAREET